MTRALLPAWLLTTVLLAQEPPPVGVLLLHSPPHAVLNDRPYIVDFIVQFEPLRIGPVHYDVFNPDTTAQLDSTITDTAQMSAVGTVSTAAASTAPTEDASIHAPDADSPLLILAPVDSADIAAAIAREEDFVGPLIKSVALFYRTDASLTFKELPMAGSYNRFQATIEKVYLTADTLTYFFTVTTSFYRIWGYPTADSGELQPIVRLLVPPSREYFRREARGHP